MKNFNIITSPLLHIILDRPRIIGNIAAIVRLSVATQCALHVCGPLVFEKGDKTKWRAGLDYFFGARVHFHKNLHRCLSLMQKDPWLIEVAKNSKAPWDINLRAGDVVIFGPEDDSILPEVVSKYESRLVTLPQPGPVRSLNLAQCASIIAFEALRQNVVG